MHVGGQGRWRTSNSKAHSPSSVIGQSNQLDSGLGDDGDSDGNGGDGDGVLVGLSHMHCHCHCLVGACIGGLEVNGGAVSGERERERERF